MRVNVHRFPCHKGKGWMMSDFLIFSLKLTTNQTKKPNFFVTLCRHFSLSKYLIAIFVDTHISFPPSLLPYTKTKTQRKTRTYMNDGRALAHIFT